MELSIGRRCLCRSVDRSAGAAEEDGYISLGRSGVVCYMNPLETALTIVFQMKREMLFSMDRFVLCATVDGHKVRFACTIRPSRFASINDINVCHASSQNKVELLLWTQGRNAHAK